MTWLYRTLQTCLTSKVQKPLSLSSILKSPVWTTAFPYLKPDLLLARDVIQQLLTISESLRGGKKRLCNVKQPCWCLQILLLEVLFFFFNFFRKPVKRELDRVQWSFVISECMHAFPPAWVACSHCSAVSKLVGLCLCINHKWFQCYWNQQSIKVHLANPRWWAQWLA